MEAYLTSITGIEFAESTGFSGFPQTFCCNFLESVV